MTPISEIPKELNSYPSLLAKLLANRGIKTKNEAERFLHPSYEKDLHDPFLFPDMERAVVRIFEAVTAGEKIAVYADYDCDGIPAGVLLFDLFELIGYSNVVIYIPDRHSEGYGLSDTAIRELAEQNVKLIVTVDLGITAVEEVALAKSLDIDVIITDHHIPQENLPKAFALINPKLGGYPEDYLCGSGVAFKLMQAFLFKYSEYFKVSAGAEKWSLDMAGLATLSDMVPLVGENRAIAHFGLLVIQKNRRAGLQALFRELKTDPKTVNEEDLVFSITPRINAASRMGSPMRAFELLSAKTPAFAKDMAKNLSALNDERKSSVLHIMKEVHKELSGREPEGVVVIGNPKWRAGVLGLVASKIVESYNCPAFVWGREGGDEIKGSCRSDGSVSVVALMESLPKEILRTFGGHEGAGGFAVTDDGIHALRGACCASYEILKNEIKENVTGFEADLSLDDVTNQTYEMVSSCAPFGLGNPKPVFRFENVVFEKVAQFGKEQNHLEGVLRSDSGKRVRAISFFSTGDSFSAPILAGEKLTLFASLEKSYFAGRIELRLRIVDVANVN